MTSEVRILPSPPENFEKKSKAGVAQLARASAFQAEGRGFEPRFPLHNFLVKAQVAQQVEHLLGKEEVTGSSPVLSSTLEVKEMFLISTSMILRGIYT